MELSCMYFKKLLVKVSIKKMYFLSLKIVFIIANSAHPGKISHYGHFIKAFTVC